MPLRAIGITSEDSSIVRQAFKLLKDNYAYIVIHGTIGNFNIFENNAWKRISHKSLAKWIAENRAYDSKTIILLSCANAASTQKLIDALAVLDKTAKRTTIRKIIAWDKNVVLYNNGYIKGYGTCRAFSSPTANGIKVLPKTLLNKEIPNGTGLVPDSTNGYVVLSTRYLTQQDLEDHYAQMTDWEKKESNLDKATLNHKAVRWREHLDSDRKSGFEAWSNRYEANMYKPENGDQAVNDIKSTLDWQDRAKKNHPIDVTVDGKLTERKIDLADVLVQHGIEVKSSTRSSSPAVYASPNSKILVEAKCDIELVKNHSWTIDWIFVACVPSKALDKLLREGGIKIICK
jgi:hypothetical protein